MIYMAYEAQARVAALLRPLAAATGVGLALPWWGALPFGPDKIWALRKWGGALTAFADLPVTYKRPPFNLAPVTVGNQLAEITEEATQATPFGTLLRFRKDIAAEQPRVLVVAPMSGHFATLLRGTVQTLVRDHDVYITDWHNARDVPVEAGVFDLAAYVEHVIGFLRAIGPGAHVVAVCQPCVPVLAAVALMAQDNDPAQPRSMTLMAGPIDTRINPTKVNTLATERPIEWFERNLTDRVPPGYAGAGRHVYPGFMQLTAFMSMNMERHLRAFGDMAEAHAEGESAKYESMRAFYEEYFAIMDLPAEFYLETVHLIFQDYALARGTLTVRGRPVEPRAIRRTALLTVEGERDDICGLGQTLAAQDLCSGLRQYMKSHHVQTGVGHYGVFSGRRWTSEIYPKVHDVIEMTN
jgi:polyhydroxyalkanoate depolymerase